MMTSDFISHKKLELKLIVYYYDESSLKETTLVVDAPELGGTPLSSIWLTTLFHNDHLLNQLCFLVAFFDQVYP